MKRRFIEHNIREVEDIHYSKAKNLVNISLLTMLDFKKAFDSIQWSLSTIYIEQIDHNCKKRYKLDKITL